MKSELVCFALRWRLESKCKRWKDCVVKNDLWFFSLHTAVTNRGWLTFFLSLTFWTIEYNPHWFRERTSERTRESFKAPGSSAEKTRETNTQSDPLSSASQEGESELGKREERNRFDAAECRPLADGYLKARLGAPSKPRQIRSDIGRHLLTNPTSMQTKLADRSDDGSHVWHWNDGRVVKALDCPSFSWSTAENISRDNQPNTRMVITGCFVEIHLTARFADWLYY